MASTTIGLRYFNVFGPRQDPNGAYAAVIPKWTAAMIKGETVFINGDGETSRDFCYVANAVQANLLAATTQNLEAVNQVYNVAVGDRTTLNELYAELRRLLAPTLSASEGRYAELPRLSRRRRAPQPGGYRQGREAVGLCADASHRPGTGAGDAMVRRAESS